MSTLQVYLARFCLVFIFTLVSMQANADNYCKKWKSTVDNTLAPLILGNTPLHKSDPQTLGAIVVISKLGEGSCTYTLGSADLEGSPINKDSSFELASLTKLFTTGVLAKYVIDKKLSLNEVVSKYLPENYTLSSQESAVTFGQLATFTGGFATNNPPDYTMDKPYSLKQFISYLSKLNPSSPIAGRKYLPTYNLYSNSSIALLGIALMHYDSLTQHKKFSYSADYFSTWLKANFTRDLQLSNNTTVWPKGPYLKGFTTNNPTKKLTLVANNQWNFKGPAGGLRSNAKDMGRFITAAICAYHQDSASCKDFPKNLLQALYLATTTQHYTPAGKLIDSRIYQLDNRTHKQKPTRETQALAWAVTPADHSTPHNNTSIIWKDGDLGGVTEWLGYSPQKAFGVLIVANEGGIDGLAEKGAALIRNSNLLL